MGCRSKSPARTCPDMAFWACAKALGRQPQTSTVVGGGLGALVWSSVHRCSQFHSAQSASTALIPLTWSSETSK
eukprot:13304120-Alexandrium_andersonii.AAC.1